MSRPYLNRHPLKSEYFIMFCNLCLSNLKMGINQISKRAAFHPLKICENLQKIIKKRISELFPVSAQFQHLVFYSAKIDKKPQYLGSCTIVSFQFPRLIGPAVLNYRQMQNALFKKCVFS